MRGEGELVASGAPQRHVRHRRDRVALGTLIYSRSATRHTRSAVTPARMIFGHEFVGEVVEAAPGVASSRSEIVVAIGRRRLVRRVRPLPRGSHEPLPELLHARPEHDGGMAEFVSAPSRCSRRSRRVSRSTRRVCPSRSPSACTRHAAPESSTATVSSSLAQGPSAPSCWRGCSHWPMPRSPSSTSPGHGSTGPPAWARRVLIPAGESVVADVLAAVDPRGADLVIEASGAPGQLANAIRMVRYGGTILQVGLPARRPRSTSTRWSSARSPCAPPTRTCSAQDLARPWHILADGPLADGTARLRAPARGHCRAARAPGHRQARRQGAVRPLSLSA